MDIVTRKLAYLWLRFVEISSNTIVYFYALLFKRKQQGEIKKIAAYWYTPIDRIGADLRFGEWKSFFEEDGYGYTNYHCNTFEDYVKYIEKGSKTKRYLYFARCIISRLPQILKAHHHDCVWIDRGIIPFYPRKNAFLERQIRKVVLKLVIDTTDGGDYQANPKLMEDTFKQADEITVGYKHLKEIYEDRFKVTQVFWTIPTTNYIIKSTYSINEKPVIGWMGSPGNFQYVREILPQLKALASSHNFLFRYLCRENYDEEMHGIDVEHHYYGDDYYKLIGSFDIGISPFLKDDLRSKGKIAMKHQEFLLMGIPQACSPVAISEFVVNNEHVSIVENKDDWYFAIKNLLENESLRQKFGDASKNLFQKYYTYPSQYEKLKTVLTKTIP